MNKQGQARNILTKYLAYFLFGVVVFGGMLYWIYGFQDGAARWEDYYAKEIVRVIDSGSAGEEAYLNVAPAVAIGVKNHVLMSDMFIANNLDNSILVKLSAKTGSKFYYFNNLSVVDVRLETPPYFPNSRIHFRLEARK